MPFIITQWFNQSELYEYNPATNKWELFSPQPTGDPFGFVASLGVFGQYDGQLWRHNGQGGNQAQFWRLESGVWNNYDEPFTPSNQGPNSYCESVDGVHKYAQQNNQVHIKKFNSGTSSWDHITLPGSAGTGVWCDSTGQYVYVVPGNSLQTLYFSDDYGATWSNIYTQLPRSDVTPGGVWGFGTGASHICYISTRRLSFTEGYIFSGNGATPWTEVASSLTHTLDGNLWGYDEDNLFAIGNDGTGGSRPWAFVLRRNGSSMDVVLSPSDARIDQGIRQLWGIDSSEIFCAFQKRFLTFEGQSYRSTDGGGTWVQIDTSAVGDTLYYPIAFQGVHLPPGYSTPPYLQNQNPAPSSTGNGADSDIYLEVVDNEGDVDTSTVDIYVNAVLAWTGDSVVQPGYSGYKVPVANGYAYVISPWENFDPGTQSVRVVADDLQSNSLDDTYTFDTVAEAGICIKVQWGDFQWGAAQWGQCVDFEVTAVAINEYTIRVFFGIAVPQIDPSGSDDALNPNNYALSGGFRQLTVLSVASVNTTTVDLTVLEMTGGAAYEIEFLFAPFITETATFTGIGVPPFVTSVTNSSRGILVVQFSETMLNDTAFGRASSYIITPQGDAKLLYVNSVSVDKDNTSQVVLPFSGGGSFYILSTPGLMDPAGNYCDPPDFLFEILNPEIDELLNPERLFLDTDMGPMALGYSELSRRRIEDLAILRARNEGHLRQFSLIADELERSGIDRDDRSLKLFKG